MGLVMKKLREHDYFYLKLKKFYGMTVGLHWLKELYLKKCGLYNGKRMVKLLGAPEADAIVSEEIKSGRPFMLARYGSTEFGNITGDDDFDLLCFYSGFFPKDEKLLRRFQEEYMKSSKLLDFLCIWNYKNHFLKKKKLISNFPNIRELFGFEPTGYKQSWVKLLEGKRVLVIHPFKKTIEAQQKKRTVLGILPKVKSLRIIKAVQTLGNNNDERFKTWFDALDYMKREIDKEDFDIALIGCGAYGLPLAAYVKSIGKQGLHLGGGLQLFFGIKGKRWNGSGIYDEAWVSPMKEDFINDYKKHEGGSYW